MVRDAWYFLLPLLFLAGLTGWAGLYWLPGVLLAAAVFVAYFFRDPEREIPPDPRAIVSPADGKVIRLEAGPDGTRLVIFLSVFDVHVNRAPISGTVIEQRYRKGAFRLAFDDRASVENEQMVWTLEGDGRLTFSLIAGLVARRIVAWKKKGEKVTKGDKIGLIRFGSRVDIFLPRDTETVVQQGVRVRGGSSIIAYWRREA